MAHRSQSSSLGDNPLHPNYLPPHYKEEYRLAIDALLEEDIQGYYEFLQSADVVGFLAQPEIEHIKATVQTPSQGSNVPELPYHEGALEEDGSSDTYWPVHSDIDAPGLDLGWPMHQHSFIGPTEVTTLVNPSDPDMPSIKEQARRLIKNAQQVVAVVMDMFTDVDIFADLLDAAARHVPVYILLDEQNAHHFVTMVTNCKVNLDMVHMMRVRTVAGVTYFCRTGKSFKGQVKDRFLLSDCRAVLSGNYSFMWSFEKLHRCIAHLFLGELVTTFDEEFRILFAQSQPLTSEHSLVPLSSSETSSTSSFYGNQFGLKRTQSLRNPRGLPRHPELPSYPFGDSDRNAGLHFRRDDLFRHSAMDPGAGITIGKFAASQQFRLQQSFLEQGRSMVTRQMEMSSSAYKRHSYAEGTQESYSSSRQYMKQRVMNNLDESEQHHHREQTQSSHYFQGESSGLGPGSGYRHYDRHSGRASQLPIDQHSDSGFPPPELEPPPHGDYGGNVFSSEDLRHTPGQSPGPGRYEGGPNHKRPTVGQPYACLSSPTQTHAPEKTVFQTPADLERSQDPTAKHGLRSWRIHSYLSNYEDAGEEGLPQPMGSDAFEDPPPPQQPTDLEASAPRFGTNEPPRVFRPDALRPRYGKPILPDSSRKDTASPTTVVEREAEREGERDRGGTREVGVDVEVREAADISFSRHDSFRTRINPLLQRSSRLRSSLIFSSSKLETHNSGLGLQPATEEDDESNPIRTSSIVAQILEKRRSMSREPFDWRRKAQEVEKENEKDKETLLKEESSIKEEPLETIKEALKNPPAAWEPPNVTTEPPKPEPKPTSSLNMNDPASRLQYFKDLAAKRKASKIGMEVSLKDSEPAPQNPDSSDTSTRAPKVPALEVTPPVMEPNKPVVATKPAGLTRKPSLTFTKPPVLSATQPKPAEITQAQREEFVSEPQRKDTVSEAPKKESSKTLKPFPSPKFFKRDTTLKPLKTPGSRRVVSCDEQTLTADATDAEKSELKKSRSHSSSSMTKTESKEGLNKNLGSNTSLNTLGFGGDGKADGKPLDFLKKQTQRLKGFLGPKDKKTAGTTASVGEDKSMGTVQEESGSATKPSSLSAKDANTTAPPTLTTNHKAAAKASPSRYQTSSGSVLFSSNLRDDTKVILEQISANSQKNRLEREETSGQEKGSDRVDEKRLDSSSLKNRFLRPQTNPQEREGLLKRIESMRKEKKVYSRFEMGNSLG